MAKSKNKKQTQMQILLSLVCTALLMALYVVLSQFVSIRIGEALKIGFAFFPAAVAARLFGPAGSIAVYALGDLLGSILFPTGGAYYPGFTVTYVCMGLVYGIFLYRKSNLVRVIIAAVLNMGLCSFLLNTYWISRLYGSEYVGLLATRWPQSLGMCIVQIVILSLVLERLCKPIEKKLGLRKDVKAVESFAEGEASIVEGGTEVAECEVIDTDGEVLDDFVEEIIEDDDDSEEE